MAYTKITGKSIANAEQMKQYIKNRNPKISQNVIDIIPLYLSEGEAEGIRGDIAFAQSCLETGNFTFVGSAVTLDQNNFCGMGVLRNGWKGNKFSTPQIGIRAQIQHLKAYANKEPLKQKCVDPRFEYVTRGCIPYIDILGIQENPKKQGWSAGKNYGPQILNILNNILKIKTISTADNTSPATSIPVLNKTKKYLGTVIADYLNVREWAGIEFKTVSFSPIKKNTVVDICDIIKAKDDIDWYYICCNGKYGFVSSKYMKITIENTTKVTKPNYLSLVAKWAPIVYNKIVELKCAHKTGANSYAEIQEKKITTCATSVSAVLQQAGCLKVGKKVSHTSAVGGSKANILKKKNTIAKAMTNIEYLYSGTCDIVKIGDSYHNIDAKYKKAGIVYVQDSNICICGGNDTIWSTNEGGGQYKNGHYFNALNKSGYCFNSVILYAIVPKS